MGLAVPVTETIMNMFRFLAGYVWHCTLLWRADGVQQHNDNDNTILRRPRSITNGGCVLICALAAMVYERLVVTGLLRLCCRTSQLPENARDYMPRVL